MTELLIWNHWLNTWIISIDPCFDLSKTIQSDKITWAVEIINKHLIKILESWNWHILDTIAEFEEILAIKEAIQNNDDFSEALMSLINELSIDYIDKYILETLRDKNLENLLQFQDIVDNNFNNDFIKKNFIKRGYDKFDKDGVLCVI